MLTALAPADGEAILPLADARVHLNLTADDGYQDAAVASVRGDAISLIEEHSRHSLKARQFLWEIDTFTRDIRLPLVPVQTVDAISYRDVSGAYVELTQGDWVFAGGFLNPNPAMRWPLTGAGRAAVQITLTAGYPTASEIPQLLMVAVKLAMTAMFEDRSNPNLGPALKMASRFRRRTL